MAAIQDLIAQIQDEALRKRIEAEVERMNESKSFGLVFEHHLPETTALYNVAIRAGSFVAKRNNLYEHYRVISIDGDNVHCVSDKGESISFLKKDVVVVVRSGDAIYPTLQPIDKVSTAPDSELWHTLIEADNYHALQLLEYLYAGKVDCIYIDPPYNTGAKDWKYNNDYVDGSDNYRHSKWLSMMERRLQIAKRLLNPEDSVLIVTIDEKEYLHLGCLLEEMFPEAKIQMVTSVISAKGVVRVGQFSRVEEYLYIVYLGNATLTQGKYNMLDNEVKKESDRDIEWLGFRRRAPQAKRESRPNQFYPIFVNNETGNIQSIGNVVPHGIDRNTIPVPDCCTALWPLSKDGDERLWSLIPEQARVNLNKGYLKVNNWNKGNHSGTVYYLASGTIEDIENNVATVLGYNSDGSIIAKYEVEGTTPPKRVWNMKTHNAETYGTKILSDIIGNRFDYPKSLYAVTDSLRFFVANKPNALILDFFAGSGTTLHAVNLLNEEDGGKRRCIMVTNNEVSNDEAKELQKRGFQQGDEEWERLGIARYVTWPRTVCSIEGNDVNGNPIKGNYLTNDRPMAEGFKANVEYFKLDFLDRDEVEMNMQFKEILPLLWMKAGAVGKRPEIETVPDMLILPENRFAVLIDETKYSEFREKVNKVKEQMEMVYIVTDSYNSYHTMAQRLNIKKTNQLYRSYLDNFVIKNEN